METEENESAGQSVCQVCKKKFKNPEKLSLHMGFHSLFGNFKKSVGHAENNNGSEEVNTNSDKSPNAESPLASPKAKSRSAPSILLVEKPFRCTKCGVNFSSMRNKIQHDLLHAKKTSGFEQRGTYTTELKCGICKKKCRTENGLQKHFETEHAHLQKEHNMTCEKCGRKFRKLSVLQSHQKTCTAEMHDTTYEDIDYDFIYAGKKRRKMNYRTIIAKKKNKDLQMYECNFCKRRCFTLKSIAAHFKKDHTSDASKDLTCEFCNQRFENLSALRSHLSSLHKDQFYDTDSDSFGTPESDDIEVNTSANSNYEKQEIGSVATEKDGEKNFERFQCSKCPLVFKTTQTLTKHLVFIHGVKGAQRYQKRQIKRYKRFRIFDSRSGEVKLGFQCLKCKAKLNSLQKLDLHLKKKHGSSLNDMEVANDTEVANGTEVKNQEDDEVSNNGVEDEKVTNKKMVEANIEADDSIQEDVSQDIKEEGDEDQGDDSESEAEGDAAQPSPPRRGRKPLKRTKKPKTNADAFCKCLQCGVPLTTEWALAEHYKNYHSGHNFEVVPKFSSAKGKYNLFLKCTLCGKLCRSKGHLKLHFKDHKRGKGTTLLRSPERPEPTVEVRRVDGTDKRRVGRPRKGSCIYHCRVCGKSFPRLYRYNEHICKPVYDRDEAMPYREEQTEQSFVDNNGNEIIRVESSEVVSQSLKKAKVDASFKQELVKARKVMQPGRRPSVQEHSMNGAQNIAKREQKKTGDVDSSGSVGVVLAPGRNSLARSPWKPKENQGTTLVKAGPKANGLLKDKAVTAKWQCRYCKRPFPNQKQLIKHETNHSEANPYTCSNCGMSFTAMHKLRYHSMRCMQNRSMQGKDQRSKGNEAKGNEEFVDGRVNGNTYPSYARKSEYTVFDPANKPDDYDFNDNIDMNGHLSAMKAITDEIDATEEADGFGGKAESSSLDNIIIADVRSCHPSFASGQCNDVAEKQQGNGGLQVPDDIPIVLPSNSEVNQVGFNAQTAAPPGYFADPPTRPYGLGERMPSQSGPLGVMPQAQGYTPGGLSPGMPTKGTVLFVPYFIPAQSNLPNGGYNLNKFIPKPASLPPGSFMINPNDFNARISPGIEPRFYSPPGSGWPNQLAGQEGATVSPYFADNQPKVDKMDWGRVPEQTTSEKNDTYECKVCDQKFITFGNYVKHRESHKR
eukprot:Seg1682.8 transcript_id=Seg1682.8/GoldUCD/mRNA.D3Y31 product="Zinc finger protein 569" protein_id=Seg1682.8/GoldUCD/D3Y31